MKRIIFVFFLIVAMINPMIVQGQSAKQLQKAKELLARVEKNPHASASEHQQAVDALLKVADKHDRQEGEALLYLGEAYSRFVPQPFRNDSLSFHYYTNAAGELPEGELKGLALYNMGVYFYKNSVHQDLAQAHSLFVLAAGFNDAVSVGAGETYEFGLGCPMNPSAAFAYYRKGLCWILAEVQQQWSLQSQKFEASFLGGSAVRNLPAMQEMKVQSLGWEDLLEEEMATHSSILAWRIPWTEEPGGLKSIWSQSRTRLSD